MLNLKNINDLIEYVKLGKLITTPEPVIGGLMHKMYTVKTDKGKYAVKELNPSIMRREGAMTNYINSENIALALSEKVPVIAAIRKDEKVIFDINGTYYMIFPWQDGKCVFPDEITTDHCRKIGEILGKIHSASINIIDIDKIYHENTVYEWIDYIELGIKESSSWVNEIQKNIENLYEWTDLSNKALKELCQEMVLSHRDLDPKNVMWNGDNVYLIDWESAGYINPFMEFIEVVSYWIVDKNGNFQRQKFNALYKEYNKYIDVSQVNWNHALNSGYSGMLGWLAYSFRRSLGVESHSDEEKKLGTDQIVLTIKSLEKYEKQSKVLEKWLTEY